MTQISFIQLQDIFNTQLNGFWLYPQNPVVKIFDEGPFNCYSDAEMRSILSNVISPSPFINEVFDCDDFAFFYKSEIIKQHVSFGHRSAVITGIASGRFGSNNERHMLNWFVNDSKKLCWIEGQTASIQSLSYCQPLTLELLIA